jgi:two-component system response regulator YesN
VTYTDEELEEAIIILDKLFAELENQDQFSPSIIKAIFTELFVSFLRKYHLHIENSHTESGHVQKAIQYIKNNFRGDITLKVLAEKLYLTPNYLGEIFTKETGKNCSTYIQDLRFVLAIQLLINSEHSMQEISEECGFHSVSYFIRKFREKYGISPLQYRLKNRETGK